MRRVINGRTFVSEGSGQWLLENHPHLRVERDDEFVTECDGVHPTPGGGYHEVPEVHFYTRWGVWNSLTNDFAFGSSPGDFATFTEAAEWLAAKVGN